MSGNYRRSKIIDDVKAAVCRDRQNAYSDAEDNFRDIADYWNLWARGRGLLKDGASFSAIDVAQMSAFIKVARAQANPLYADNWVDQAGYAVCGGGIAAMEREKRGQDTQEAPSPEPGSNGQNGHETAGNLVQSPPSQSLFAARNGPENGRCNPWHHPTGS